MKSRIFASAALAVSTIAMVSCGQATEETSAAPEGVDGVTVENVRLVLPAVAANPGVVYFDLSYAGDTPQTLAAVEVAGAGHSMMHDYVATGDTVQMVPMEPVELTKGSTVSFEPRGKHVMAMDVSPELKAGGKTEVTLTFASGDKQSVSADIRATGDAL